MTLPVLSAEALAPFLTILKGEPGKPVIVPAVMESDGTPGHHAYTILSPKPVDGTSVTVAKLERHRHTTQTFVPVTVSRWLVLVAPDLPDGNPDMTKMQAYVAGPNDSICIHQNVWHAGLTVFDGPAEFGMIMWKTDAGDDADKFMVENPVTLSLD